MTETRLSAKELIQEWQTAHPNATQTECAKALGISRQTVNLYSKKTQISSEEAMKKVFDWFEKHPDASQIQCCKETNLSKATVSKYFNLWKMTTKKRFSRT